ncbi:MAG: hypothetical protein RLZZ531_2142 [Bacteroidota bacterium]|jgi:hypothetical protein
MCKALFCVIQNQKINSFSVYLYFDNRFIYEKLAPNLLELSENTLQ